MEANVHYGGNRAQREIKNKIREGEKYIRS